MEINYPDLVIKKGNGVTDSESYLYKLCNKLFLSLWCFPNLYRDQGRIKGKDNIYKGDGKELCDLLVVFENHVFIFSDKSCKFPDCEDIQTGWSRWYKKTVRDSAYQIWGTERWLFSHPDTIYLDKKCTQPFPYRIPSKEEAIVHRIVVAHGASTICKRVLGGNGSLMLSPNIIGDDHIRSEERGCQPFKIGQVDLSKGYVHVFDDYTLDVILNTLDTITDFASYLIKKEELLLSDKLFEAAGEEELLAMYLTNINESGEHCFLSNKLNKPGYFAVDEGFWDSFSNNPLRKAQIEADKISYAWDEIIEKFAKHIFDGTSYYLSNPDINSQAEIFKFLARENRLQRRGLASKLIEFVVGTPANCRATRIISSTKEGDPFYLFLVLPLSGAPSYEKYRELRRCLLADYIEVLKLDYPNALDIVGIATESGNCDNRSEDIVYLNARNWSEKDNEIAREIKEDLISHKLLNDRTKFYGKEDEYPNSKVILPKGSDRNKPCLCGSGKKYKNCCGKK